MNDDSTRQSVLLWDLLDKQVIARFGQPYADFDGGALLLETSDPHSLLVDRLCALPG